MKTERVKADDYRSVYVVGDIHGCYDELMGKLNSLDFDKKQDLLVSVGDLIDRGPESLKCLSLIEEPWFKCIQGNHELMAYTAITRKSTWFDFWYKHGGEWHRDLEDAKEAERLILDAIKLPHVIEIERRGTKTVVCHADYPLDKYDPEATDADDYDCLQWGRHRIEKRIPLKQNAKIEGADLFIFGHTPQSEILKSHNQIFIDTGACYTEGYLTVINLDEYITC